MNKNSKNKENTVIINTLSKGKFENEMKQIESDDLFEEEDINECENINMNEKIDFIKYQELWDDNATDDKLEATIQTILNENTLSL